MALSESDEDKATPKQTMQVQASAPPGDFDEIDDLVALAAIGQLSRGLAHTFNNVLAGIVLNAELLSLAETERRQNLLHRIMKSAEHGANLCRAVLNLTDLVSEGPLPVEAGPLLSEAVALFHSEAHRHSIAVMLTVPEGLRFFGIPALIQQLVLNVLLCAQGEAGSNGQIVVDVSSTVRGIHVWITASPTSGSGDRSDHAIRGGQRANALSLAASQRLADRIGATLSCPDIRQYVLQFPAVPA